MVAPIHSYMFCWSACGVQVLLCASDRVRLGVVESPPNGELVFTASNWATPQEVSVLATETDSAEVDTPFDVDCSVSSSDPAYAALNGRDPEPLTFLREDLTVAGFSSYKRGYTTSESGRAVEWFVRTLSPPRSPVLVKAACTPTTVRASIQCMWAAWEALGVG